MKKALALAALLIGVLVMPLIFTACGPGNITAPLGKEFTISAGQTARITDASLKIKFVEVTADSRCAQGVQCVQAGQVDCLMLIYYYNSQTSMTFTQTGGEDVTQQDFNVYTISFKVLPYPQAGKTIKPGDYKMVITVVKQGS